MAGTFQVNSPGGVPRTAALPVVRNFASSLLQGGHGSLTVTTGTGVLLLAGLAPRVAISALSGVGALSVTGLAPQVRKATLSGVGVLAVAGFAPRIVRTALTKTGALTLSGLAPTVGIGRVVLTSPGALTLTGLSPTVQLVLAPRALAPFFMPAPPDPRYRAPFKGRPH